MAAHGVAPATPELEYVDRTYPAELARGLWAHPATLIQHPTQHHWPGVSDVSECKKLFWRNFPGDPQTAETIFAARSGVVERQGWTFDASAGTYATDAFWPAHARPWTAQRVALTAAQR